MGTWPTDDLTNNHTDAGADDPTQARDEINSAILKIKAILAAAVAVATASTVVLRDASANFAANFITAVKIIGDVAASDGTIVLDSGSDGTDATFTGDVAGNLNGNVTGNVAGNLTGNLLGTPTAPTQIAGNSSTRVATTSFVTEAVSSAVGSNKTTINVTAPIAWVQFTGLTGSRRLQLSIKSVVPSEAVTRLTVQTSSDNGSTWITSASYGSAPSNTVTQVAPTLTSMVMHNSAGDFPASAKTGMLEILELGQSVPTIFFSKIGTFNAAGNIAISSQIGVLSLPNAHNAIRIIAETGNINSGHFVLEEIE